MTSRTKHILQAISFSGLALSIIPAFLVFTGVLSKEIYLHLMVVGMPDVVWQCCFLDPKRSFRLNRYMKDEYEYGNKNFTVALRIPA